MINLYSMLFRAGLTLPLRSSLRPLTIVSLAAIALIVPWRQAAGETLHEALVRAYVGNPALIAARAQLRQTDELSPQALGGWRPQVNASGSVGATSVEQTSNGYTVSNSSYPTNLTLQATQPLYTFGRVEAKVEAADATIESQRAALFRAEQDTFISAVTAYMTVIRESATLSLQRNNLDRLDRQLEATTARFEVDDLTRTDVAQAQASVAEARANVRQAEASLAQARVTYERVIGSIPGQLTVPTLPTALPETRSAAVDAATDGNFALIQASFAEAAAAHQLDAAESDLLPSLDLVADVSRAENSGGGDNLNWAATATLRLSVPLYQSGIASSKAREAHENLRRLRFTAIDQLRSAREEAANAFEALQGNLSQIDALETQISAATLALEGVRSEAAVGARTVLDVLDAEQSLLDGQVRLVRARYDVLVSGYQLLAAMGRLTAQDLALPVDYYDYDRHYREVRDRWYGLATTGDRYFQD